MLSQKFLQNFELNTTKLYRPPANQSISSGRRLAWRNEGTAGSRCRFPAKKRYNNRMARRAPKASGNGPRWMIVFTIIGIVVAAAVVFSAIAMWRFARHQAAKPLTLGVTFSQKEAQVYGNNWQKNYLALLDELHFKHLRIMAYWDVTEPQPGQYDFSQTDWMIEQAKARGAHVTLVVGQRQPRYPECFYPSWLNKNDPAAVRWAVNQYITATAAHYRNEPAIEDYQLENEFLLTVFGTCPKANLSSRALQTELKTLQAADVAKPVVVTASDEFGLPVFGPTGDIFGLSLYKTVWNPITHHGYFTYPQPSWFNWWRAAVVWQARGSEARVHELQAEPWGPVANQDLSEAEAAKSMNPDKLRRILAYAERSKIKRIDLWGAEWWYWEKTQRGNAAMWDAVQALGNKN